MNENNLQPTEHKINEEMIIRNRCSETVGNRILEEQIGGIDLTDVSLVSGEGSEQNGYSRRSIDVSRERGPIEHARRRINLDVDRNRKDETGGSANEIMEERVGTIDSYNQNSIRDVVNSLSLIHI